MEPVSAIGSTSPGSLNPQDAAWKDSGALADCVGECGGAYVLPKVTVTAPANSDMSLLSLSAQLSDGMKNGFLTREMKQLVGQLRGKGTPEAITEASLDLHAKMGLASVSTKVANKLVDGLQSLILKSG